MAEASPSTPDGDLRALAQRGRVDPSSLSAAEVARVCEALARLLEEQDDIILQPRWRDPADPGDPAS